LYLVTLNYDPILYLMIKLDLELGRDCTVFEARRDSLDIDLFTHLEHFGIYGALGSDKVWEMAGELDYRELEQWLRK
jgi:hypothetical protein